MPDEIKRITIVLEIRSGSEFPVDFTKNLTMLALHHYGFINSTVRKHDVRVEVVKDDDPIH
jgi:hypothetical protein